MVPYHIDSDEIAVNSGTFAFTHAERETECETLDAYDHAQRMRIRDREASSGIALIQWAFVMRKQNMRTILWLTKPLACVHPQI